MVNNIIFCNSFIFNIHRFKKYKCTDNSRGVEKNYFAYMIRGNVKICAENETVIIKEGDTFFIPSGCRYLSHWYGNPDVEFISLGFVFMPNFENAYYAPQILKKNEEATDMMWRIAKRNTVDSLAIGEFYTLVALLMQNMKPQGKSKQAELVDKVKQFIALNPCATTADIAKRYAVSETTLYGSFRNYSEKSMNDFKKEVLMKKAAELLTSTDLSIEEISQKLNFSSSAYFRKCFKEYFAASPRELRKKMDI